jgi:hypothetical protein
VSCFLVCCCSVGSEYLQIQSHGVNRYQCRVGSSQFLYRVIAMLYTTAVSAVIIMIPIIQFSYMRRIAKAEKVVAEEVEEAEEAEEVTRTVRM